MDVLQCLSEGEEKPKCKAFAEDYVECLHHRKEFARHLAVQAEKAKNEKAAAAAGGGHGGH